MSGVSEVADGVALEHAIAALASELGADAVSAEEQEVREYRDPYDYKGSDRYTASAVVTPRSVEEVQAVVRIANEFRVPLWTFGQGRNNAYGGSAPRVKGSILAQHARDEPRARGQRRPRLRAGRAGCELLRPLRAPAGGRVPPVAVDSRPRVGERDRQHARVRARLHQPRRAPGDGVRPRGRAREGRGRAHGDGRDGRRQGVELLPVVVRPLACRPLLPVQLRHRHEDGRLADAPPRGVHLRLGEVRRRPDDRPVHRRRARADARRDDPQPAAAGLRPGHRRGDHLRRGGLGAALRALRPQAILDAQYEIVRETLEAIPGVEVGRRMFTWEERPGVAATTTRCTAACPAWS